MPELIKWQIAEVLEIRQETPTAKSLVLDVPDWKPHLAGQHVDVRLTAEDGYQTQRSYSIASPPEEKNLILTVERIDDGEVSPYLTEELRVGDRLELRGPIGGYFVWEAGKTAAPLFLVAGGSGIVPLMAMLRHRTHFAKKAPARLLYSSRSFEEIIYRQELEALTASDASLQVIYTLTRKQPENWTAYRRRIDSEMLAETVWEKTLNPDTYICGPTALVETAANYLTELGFEAEHIKTERFGPTGG